MVRSKTARFDFSKLAERVSQALVTSTGVRSKSTGQWKCISLAVVLTFILTLLGTFLFEEVTQINPFSINFQNPYNTVPSMPTTINSTIAEPTTTTESTTTTEPTTTTESTTTSTTSVKPIEVDHCINKITGVVVRFSIGDTQYVKTRIDLVISIVRNEMDFFLFTECFSGKFVMVCS